MVVPSLYHLANGPELINEGRSLDVGEVQVPSDALEALLGHEGAEIVGAWVLLLLSEDGVVFPKLINIPSRTRRHQKMNAEEAEEFAKSHRCGTCIDNTCICLRQ